MDNTILFTAFWLILYIIAGVVFVLAVRDMFLADLLSMQSRLNAEERGEDEFLTFTVADVRALRKEINAKEVKSK